MRFVSTKALVRRVQGYQIKLPGTSTSHGKARVLSADAPKIDLSSRGASESRRMNSSDERTTVPPTRMRVPGGSDSNADGKFTILQKRWGEDRTRKRERKLVESGQNAY